KIRRDERDSVLRGKDQMHMKASQRLRHGVAGSRGSDGERLGVGLRPRALDSVPGAYAPGYSLSPRWGSSNSDAAGSPGAHAPGYSLSPRWGSSNSGAAGSPGAHALVITIIL